MPLRPLTHKCTQAVAGLEAQLQRLADCESEQTLVLDSMRAQVYMHILIYTHTCMHLYIYIYMHTHVYIHACICTYVYICIHMYTYMHASAHIICIHMYSSIVHTQILTCVVCLTARRCRWCSTARIGIHFYVCVHIYTRIHICPTDSRTPNTYLVFDSMRAQVCVWCMLQVLKYPLSILPLLHGMGWL